MIQIVPVKFEVFLEPDPIKRMGYLIYIECRDMRGPESEWKWAVTFRGACVGRDLDCEYDRMPRSRDEEFLKSYRFSFEEAKEIALRFVKIQSSDSLITQ
jgi:hypothetical protein